MKALRGDDMLSLYILLFLIYCGTYIILKILSSIIKHWKSHKKDKASRKRNLLLRAPSLTALIIIIVIAFGMYIQLQMKYTQLEDNLRDHLIRVEGYSPSEIVSIEAELSKMPKYPVYVEFADDPGVKYTFTDQNSNQWFQLSPTNPQRLKSQ